MVRPRRKEGEWGEEPSLAITAMFCLEFAYVFRFSVSMRKVVSEHPFCVLIYMYCYIFHIYFILFIFLYDTYLIFDFICLTLSLADTHGIAKLRTHTHTKTHTHTHTHTHKSSYLRHTRTNPERAERHNGQLPPVSKIIWAHRVHRQSWAPA